MTDIFTATMVEQIKTVLKPIGDYVTALNPVTAYLKQLNTNLQNVELYTRSNLDLGKVHTSFGKVIQSVGGNYSENLKQVAVNFDAGVRSTGSTLLTLQKELRQTGVDTTKSSQVFAELYGATGGNTEAIDELAGTIMKSSDDQMISISRFVDAMSKVTQQLKNTSIIAGDPLLASKISNSLLTAFPKSGEQYRGKIAEFIMSPQLWGDRLMSGMQGRIEQLRTATPEEMTKLLPGIVKDAFSKYEQIFSQSADLSLEQKEAVLGDRAFLYASLKTLMADMESTSREMKDAQGTGAINTITATLEDIISKTPIGGALGGFFGTTTSQDLALFQSTNIASILNDPRIQTLVQGASQFMTAPMQVLLNALNGITQATTGVPQAGVAAQSMATAFSNANQQVVNFEGNLKLINDAMTLLRADMAQAKTIVAQTPALPSAITEQEIKDQLKISSENLDKFIQSLKTNPAIPPNVIKQNTEAYERFDEDSERQALAATIFKQTEQIRTDYFNKLQQAASTGDQKLFEARFQAMQASINQVIGIVGGYIGVPGLGANTASLGLPPMALTPMN